MPEVETVGRENFRVSNVHPAKPQPVGGAAPDVEGVDLLNLLGTRGLPENDARLEVQLDVVLVLVRVLGVELEGRCVPLFEEEGGLPVGDHQGEEPIEEGDNPFLHMVGPVHAFHTLLESAHDLCP